MPKPLLIVIMIAVFVIGLYLTSAAFMNIWLAFHPLYAGQYHFHLAWAGAFFVAALGCAVFEFWAVRRLLKT
jgi:hypothetical protein